MCSKIFQSRRNLIRHMWIHTGTISCTSCRIVFSTEEERREHNKLKHVGFMCETCGQSFTRKNSLKKHLSSKHKFENFSESCKEYKCSYSDCERTFSRKTKYEDHMNKHLELSPHECSKCKRTFSSKYSRNRHHKICTFGQKFTCEECFKVFCSEHNLYNHSVAFHGDKQCPSTSNEQSDRVESLVEIKIESPVEVKIEVDQ